MNHGLLFLPQTKSYPSSRHLCPIDSAGGESLRTYGLKPSQRAGIWVSMLLSAVIGPLAVDNVMFTSASLMFDLATTCCDSPTMSWSVPVSPSHLVPLERAGVDETLAYFGISSLGITRRQRQQRSEGPSWWSHSKPRLGSKSTTCIVSLRDFAQRIAASVSASLGFGQSLVDGYSLLFDCLMCWCLTISSSTWNVLVLTFLSKDTLNTFLRWEDMATWCLFFKRKIDFPVQSSVDLSALWVLQLSLMHELS